MAGPLTRILLRYGAGALVAYGLMSPALADQIAYDPDLIATVEVLVGVALAGAVEGYYWAARKWGWST
jgi:hypothetical protein